MVLLEIHTTCIAILEFERDAPGAVHVDGVANRAEPTKRMEVEPGDIQVLTNSCPINDIQPT